MKLDNHTMQFKVDENKIFSERQLHLKMEIYCQEAATSRMLNSDSNSEENWTRLMEDTFGACFSQRIPLACEFTILIEVLLPTSLSNPSVGAWLNLITMSWESERVSEVL